MNSQTRFNVSAPETRGCCSSAAPSPAVAAPDPVCGMQVDPIHAQPHAAYAGTTYFFCSLRCHDRFTAEPGKYVGSAAQPQTADDKGCCSTSTTALR